MRLKALQLLLGAALALAWSTGVYGQPATPPFDASVIDGFIQATMDGDLVPGVALAIVHRDQIVYLRGYGSDGYNRPVTGQTSFILGSMSKSFTALAVMQLVERGQVALDAPVQRYLPWFRVADPAASAAITVRHLLQHTSGIGTYAPQAGGDNATLADHVRALADLELNAAPGTRHEYASPNYLVLGALIEQISGQRYGEYIEQQVFAPLEMRQSFTDQGRATANGMAQGHRYWFGFPVATTLPYEAGRMPTAALISSAEDLGKYLIAQLNGGTYGGRRVLAPAGVAQMHEAGAPGDGFSYAFGWRVSTIGGVGAIHHGGIVPHFRGKMVMLPEQGWGVVVLTNASTSFPLPIIPTSHRIADEVAAYLAGQPLSTRSYNQKIVYWAITIALASILWSQLVGLLRLRRWGTQLASRSSSRVMGELALELGWPLVVLLGLPLALGLPWSEFLRGTPDMACWLLASILLGLLTGVGKGVALWRNRSILVSPS